MTVRRWFCVAVLSILASGAGCQSWCSRHYPCPQAGYGYQAPAPMACAPCCPPASGYPAPAPAPAPAAWNAPRAAVPCVPCQ